MTVFRRARWLVLVVVTVLTVVADQITKAYVVSQLEWGESWVPIKPIESVFRFTHAHNTGAAFGIFPQGGTIFLAIAVIVSLVIIYYYREIPDGRWLVRVALGLQLGGALGNVIDRVRQGYVVDFFDVSLWPVFNVADSAIVVGVGLLVIEMLRDEWREAQQKKNSDHSDENSASEEQTLFG